MNDKRGSWDSYFIRIAREVATRATCVRKHVGCVLVRDKAILATGYNGSLRGLDHCDDVGHLMQDGHCVRTVHAEANAIAQAARNGVRLEGATAYVTAFPCWPCFKLLMQAGIVRVAFDEAYRAEDVVLMAAIQMGVSIERVVEEEHTPSCTYCTTVGCGKCLTCGYCKCSGGVDRGSVTSRA